MLNSFLYLRKDSEQDNGHSSDLDQWKSGILLVKTVHKVNGTKIAEKLMLTFAESTHPVFRATSPLSRGVLKSKGGGKLSIHYCADQETIKTVIRTITSVNQLSLYGAVAEMCEECESYHDRTGGPVVGGQSSSSFVPSVIKTNVPSNDDDPAHKEFLLQRYGERIEKLSQQDRLSKNLYRCRIPDYSWNRTVFQVERHWRILTIHRFNGLSWVHLAKRWRYIWTERLNQREHQKLGPYWKLQPVAYKVNMEWRSELSLWTKTIQTHGSEFLMAWISWSRTWTTTSRKPQKFNLEEHALKLNANDFESRSKAKAKPQRRTSASSSTRTIPIGERTWTDVQPGKYSRSDYPVSKKLIHLLRHGSLPRDNDGAIEFWRLKDCLQNHFLFCHHWSDEKRKNSMAGGGGQKKRFQYCSDSSGTILYLRALQGHSGRNLLDPSLQDNVIVRDVCLQVHLSRRMCNQFTFQHQFRIDTGRTKVEQKTDSIHA